MKLNDFEKNTILNILKNYNSHSNSISIQEIKQQTNFNEIAIRMYLLNLVKNDKAKRSSSRGTYFTENKNNYILMDYDIKNSNSRFILKKSEREEFKILEKDIFETIINLNTILNINIKGSIYYIEQRTFILSIYKILYERRSVLTDDNIAFFSSRIYKRIKTIEEALIENKYISSETYKNNIESDLKFKSNLVYINNLNKKKKEEKEEKEECIYYKINITKLKKIYNLNYSI